MKTLILSALIAIFGVTSAFASEVSESNSGDKERTRIVREVR